MHIFLLNLYFNFSKMLTYLYEFVLNGSIQKNFTEKGLHVYRIELYKTYMPYPG